MTLAGAAETVYGLIHSPLVGPDTWQPVADALRRGGAPAVVPELIDAGPSAGPYWQQHAESAAAALRGLPGAPPLVLAAHSGAGPLLPLIRQALGRPAAAYVFVDAGLPLAAGRTRLSTFDPAQQADFRRHLEGGGRFPEWTSDALRALVPDDETRRRLVAGLRPRGLDFFTEPFPEAPGWPDAPCAYLQLSPPYAGDFEQAMRAGWPVKRLEAGHFHLLAAPEAVAEALRALAAAARGG